MAANQETNMENGEDFSQDVKTEPNFVQDDQMNRQNNEQNGSEAEDDASDASLDIGDAEATGLDYDRILLVATFSWETHDSKSSLMHCTEELREHFGKYGKIERIKVKRHYAFVVFDSPETSDKAIKAGEHFINSKKVNLWKVKTCHGRIVVRGVRAFTDEVAVDDIRHYFKKFFTQAKARHGTIFVGGITDETSDDDILTYFGQFGTIIDVEIPLLKTKNQRLGTCFMTFESEEVVNELLKKPKHVINGKELVVFRVTLKPGAIGSMREEVNSLLSLNGASTVATRRNRKRRLERTRDEEFKQLRLLQQEFFQKQQELIQQRQEMMEVSAARMREDFREMLDSFKSAIQTIASAPMPPMPYFMPQIGNVPPGSSHDAAGKAE